MSDPDSSRSTLEAYLATGPDRDGARHELGQPPTGLRFAAADERRLEMGWAGAQLATPVGVVLSHRAADAEAIVAAWSSGARSIDVALGPGATPRQLADELLLARLRIGAYRAGAPARSVRPTLLLNVDGRRTAPAALLTAVQQLVAAARRPAERLRRLAPSAALAAQHEARLDHTEPTIGLVLPIRSVDTTWLHDAADRLLRPDGPVLLLALSADGLDRRPTEGSPEPEPSPCPFEDAVGLLRYIDERAESRGAPFGVRLTPGRSHRVGALRPQLELGRLLTNRFRSRLDLSIEAAGVPGDLGDLAAAGLLVAVQATQDPAASPWAALPARLGALEALLREAGAADLADFACGRALACADGKPFRRHLREHAEANRGVCLHDRLWAAAWRSLATATAAVPLVRRLAEALDRAGATPAERDGVVAEARGAAYRVNRARL